MATAPSPRADPGQSPSPPTPDDLRAWRKARGLTQEQLARRLGVSRLAVQSWEGARRPIPPMLRPALNGLDAAAPPNPTP